MAVDRVFALAVVSALVVARARAVARPRAVARARVRAVVRVRAVARVRALARVRAVARATARAMAIADRLIPQPRQDPRCPPNSGSRNHSDRPRGDDGGDGIASGWEVRRLGRRGGDGQEGAAARGVDGGGERERGFITPLPPPPPRENCHWR